MNGDINISQLTYTTRCKMKKADGTPCGFPIHDRGHHAEIIGQPDARVMRFIGALVEHMGKKHPEALAIAQRTQAVFFGYLVISAFDSPDPNIQATKKQIEDTLRRMVTPVPVTDGELESGLAHMNLILEDPHRPMFLQVLKNLRNYYEGNLPCW